MDGFFSNALLITANVGSLFEDPENLFKKWFTEFSETVKEKSPDFIALHCQEVGGKNYEESMQYVNQFIKNLLALPSLQEYDKAKIYLDEDFTAEDKFTALGNLYFFHTSLNDVNIWNFHDGLFTPVSGREVFSGSIEGEQTKEKAKFPIDFFPEARWSRKGFMRTRWQVNHVEFDLVNIHLFHDSSNLVSAEQSPSLYSNFRHRALRWTFERFAKDGLEQLPFFIFGDFNFRLDTCQMLKKFSESANVEYVRNKKDEVSKVILQDQSNQPILTVGKKSFDHHDQHDRFFLNNDCLRDYDTESAEFGEFIQEFSISFPPSYPFSEEVENALSYMRTRCPSWCDRIFYSHAAKDIMVLDKGHPLNYSMIGKEVCMGDHKPIFLHIHLKARPGRSSLVCHLPVTVRHAPAHLSPPLVVNGEVEEADVWSIFDYAQFENEDSLEPGFRFSYKSHSSVRSEEGGSRFSEVARDVVRAEGVILAFRGCRRRRQISESTEDDEEEEEQSKTNAGSSANGCQRSSAS